MMLGPLSLTSLQTGETTAIGVLIGLLGGLFGKGGSAVATPLLRLIGLPGFIAVASPLPATAPSTLVASAAYWKEGFIDWRVVRWGVAIGIPATIIGALLSKVTGSNFLLLLTGFLVMGFGVSFLFVRIKKIDDTQEFVGGEPNHFTFRIAAISVVVGVISGLLANSGGFLFAPLYAKVLRLRIKSAFACSLVVSAVLAIPGTLVHWYLGHISWWVTLLVAIGSVPLSYIGARIAIRSDSARLEQAYGVVLTLLGAFFIFHH